jgi:hypothetical protein
VFLDQKAEKALKKRKIPTKAVPKLAFIKILLFLSPSNTQNKNPPIIRTLMEDKSTPSEGLSAIPRER